MWHCYKNKERKTDCVLSVCDCGKVEDPINAYHISGASGGRGVGLIREAACGGSGEFGHKFLSAFICIEKYPDSEIRQSPKPLDSNEACASTTPSPLKCPRLLTFHNSRKVKRGCD